MNTLAAYATTGNVGESIVFWVCAVVSVAGALGMLFSRKAVHSALFLAATMISLAVLYISLQAAFLGVVQVIVYTGAIMMLFLFVLMMVGVDASDSLVETIRGQRVAASLFGVALAVLLITAVGSAITEAPIGLDAANAADGGNAQGIARLIFGRYLLAFEATSALLITAALGAMVLAFRERYKPKLTQTQISQQRFLDGGHVTPLPGPGVYARHNAIGTPALLPDGSTSDLSVPEPLRGRGVLVSADRVDLDQVRYLADRRPVIDGVGPLTGAGKDPVAGATASTEHGPAEVVDHVGTATEPDQGADQDGGQRG